MIDGPIIPAAPAPSGFVSSFGGRTARTNSLTVVNVIFLVISTLALCLRLFTRIHVMRLFGLDDYITILALGLSALQCALCQKMIDHGVGKHIWDVPLSTFSPKLLKTWMIAAITYSVSFLTIKVSILLLYRRIIPIENFRIQWWVTLAITVGYSVGGICASIFSCTPIAKYWDLTITNGHCINTGAFYIANGVLNALTDLTILALPIPIVWGLTLSRKRKFGISALFAIGSFTCIVSVIRVALLSDFIKYGSTDPTYYILSAVTWGYIEYNCAIICACAVTFKPFLQRYLGFLFPSKSCSGARTTRFSRSVTSKRFTDHRFKSFEMTYLMDGETQECENQDNIELGATPEPGSASIPSIWPNRLSAGKD